MRNLCSLMIALSLVSLASACQAPAPAPVPPGVAVALPVWPQPPAAARIRYVRSVSGPRDWGIVKSFFRRMVDALAARGEEHFIRPAGVATHDGVLYVADPGAQALWILDAAQNRSFKVLEAGKSALVSPVAIAVRPDGAVFVADTLLNKIFLFDREGKLIRVAVDKGLNRPAALAFDPARDELYVGDSAADRVGVYGSDGALIRTWGHSGSGDGEFNHPTHLALDRSGTLLVTDALNFRIQAFDREGRYRWKLGRHGDGSGDFAAPKGLASDGAGHVYVVDALFDAVQIFDRDGDLLLAFGEHGSRAGQFWLPAGLSIDPQGRIYVADAYNQRIQVFAPEPDKRTNQ